MQLNTQAIFFIYEYFRLNQLLISYFESNKKKQHSGVTMAGVNLDVKNSTDISIKPNEVGLSGNEVLAQYFDSFFDCHKDYLLQWPFFAKYFKNSKGLLRKELKEPARAQKS